LAARLFPPDKLEELTALPGSCSRILNFRGDLREGRDNEKEKGRGGNGRGVRKRKEGWEKGTREKGS